MGDMCPSNSSGLFQILGETFGDIEKVMRKYKRNFENSVEIYNNLHKIMKKVKKNVNRTTGEI